MVVVVCVVETFQILPVPCVVRVPLFCFLPLPGSWAIFITLAPPNSVQCLLCAAVLPFTLTYAVA